MTRKVIVNEVATVIICGNVIDKQHFKLNSVVFTFSCVTLLTTSGQIDDSIED